MLPPAGTVELEDRAFELIQRASGLGARVAPPVRASIGALVRSMNCYYSNLIEGHNTHPRDIDRALNNDYSTEPEKRDLQTEAVAHIHVQRLIDRREDLQAPVTSVEYMVWLHREFYRQLPENLLWVINPETGERLRVDPGALRQRTVAVGRHVPPHPDRLRDFLGRFAEAYDPRGMSKTQQIVAVAAAHHRFAWIHPFLDGNGRVARLMSHAWFARLEIGDSLWAVARGLARASGRYKTLLMAADEPRRHDTDGRGTLSQGALIDFCRFFLDACIDQVAFMEGLLEPATLVQRIEQYVTHAGARGEIHPRAFPLLRETLLMGQVPRSAAAALLGVTDRHARDIVATLIERGFLQSDGQGAPLRLAFPSMAVDAWFPKLYPEPLN
ncbi:MAG: Fic family protein [Pirellulaceae bacterium]